MQTEPTNDRLPFPFTVLMDTLANAKAQSSTPVESFLSSRRKETRRGSNFFRFLSVKFSATHCIKRTFYFKHGAGWRIGAPEKGNSQQPRCRPAEWANHRPSATAKISFSTARKTKCNYPRKRNFVFYKILIKQHDINKFRCIQAQAKRNEE